MRTKIAFGIAEIVAIVLLLPASSFRALCQPWASNGPQSAHSDPETRSVWDGVYNAEQAKRGEEVYTSRCSLCHGDKLQGVEDAPSLVGKGFLTTWDGLPLGTLFEKMSKKMPQDNPGQLTRQQYLDVLSYLMSANKFPAGSTELPQELEQLKLIRIDAIKPEARK
jgi:mono/diheme cytochrome c family protein